MAFFNFSERQKSILYLVGALLCIIILGYLIYVIFFKPEGPPRGYENINGELVNITGFPYPNENVNRAVTENANITPGLPSISPVARGGDTLVNDLTNGPTIGAELIGDFTYYYDPSTGKFYRIGPSGERIELGDGVTYKGATGVEWSPDGSRVVLEFLDGSNIMYDFQTNTQATLPKEIEEVAFSPKGESIGFEYVTDNPDINFIGVSNPNGSEIRNVQMLGEEKNDVAINWSPGSDVVATYRENTSGTTQNVYFVGKEHENFKALQIEGRGYEGQWTEDGENMVYSIYSGATNYNPTLWVANARGDNTGLNKIDTGLQTWASKCAVTASAAYCAVPSSLPEGSALAPELARDSKDSFWKVDLVSGSRTLLANPVSAQGTGSYSAQQVMVSGNEDLLYFRDANTGQLHYIKLKE